MRARLVMKMVSIVVMLVITVMGARSCGGHSSPASPLNPTNVLSNGVKSLCANEAAQEAAAGQSGTPQLSVPAGDAGLAAAAGLKPGSLSCATTTTAVPGG